MWVSLNACIYMKIYEIFIALPVTRMEIHHAIITERGEVLKG